MEENNGVWKMRFNVRFRIALRNFKKKTKEMDKESSEYKKELYNLEMRWRSKAVLTSEKLMFQREFDKLK